MCCLCSLLVSSTAVQRVLVQTGKHVGAQLHDGVDKIASC